MGRIVLGALPIEARGQAFALHVNLSLDAVAPRKWPYVKEGNSPSVKGSS